MAVTVEPDITNLSREELIALVHRQKQEIYTLRRLHFGSSSERHVAVPDSQSELELFNEAEMLVLAPPVDSEDDISMSEDAQASVAETPPVSVGKTQYSPAWAKEASRNPASRGSDPRTNR
jgi:hypothetical protein